MLMFTWRLNRRKWYYARIVGFVALYVGLDYVSMLVNMYLSAIWLHFIYNIAMFFVLCSSLLILYREKFLVTLFCGISAKCAMHIAEYFTKIIFYFTIKNTYLSMALYTVVYVVVYFLFARKIRSEECVYLNNFKLVMFTLIILLTTDVIILWFDDKGGGMTEQINIFIFVLIMIICVVVLYLQYMFLDESRHKIEAAVISQIREKEREQYEISKENIRLIGIRQHDLKNLLESRNIGLHTSELNEIVESLEGYNMPYKTGNRTLDIILMEKNSVCKSLNIRLECQADGGQMGFISDMDIYSLFLNALNNAIESAKKIDDEAKRIIWLKIYSRGKLLFIQVQNYYDYVLQTPKGFETTKTDKNNHGFGLRSMKMITEKYGGEMSVKAANGKFCLGFAIPVPENEQQTA